MRVRWSLAFALFACGAPARAPTASQEHPQPPGPVRHVVVVSIDGLLPDAYVHPDAHGLRVPTLRSIVARGAAAMDGSESVFPSVTYPSHTSMVTGVRPSKHAIVTNRTFDPLDRDWGGWRWYAEDVARDPIWRLVERAGYTSATVWWPVTAGARVSWRVPEYWRAKTENDQKLVRALSTPDLLEQVAHDSPNFWERFQPPEVDDTAIGDIATFVIEHHKPTLELVHLVDVDSQQHDHGLWSPEAIAAIEKDDHELARILASVDRAGLGEDTNVIVVSDHGFMDAPKLVEPCALLRDGGFVTLDARGRIASWKAAILSSGGQAYVYLHAGEGKETSDAVRALFAAKLSDPDGGISRVYDPDEIRALGGDPRAAMAIEASPTFQFGASCGGSYVGAHPAYPATHGYDPRRPELRASMLFYGKNVPHGVIKDAHVIDVAPTIAAWLGIEMKDVEGHALGVEK